jgi:hypothetical protein
MAGGEVQAEDVVVRIPGDGDEALGQAPGVADERGPDVPFRGVRERQERVEVDAAVLVGDRVAGDEPDGELLAGPPRLVAATGEEDPVVIRQAGG